MEQSQDLIGFQLLQVHRAHRAGAEAALNKLGLYTGQEMLLPHLWREEAVSQSYLAICLELNRQQQRR